MDLDLISFSILYSDYYICANATIEAFLRVILQRTATKYNKMPVRTGLRPILTVVFSMYYIMFVSDGKK